MSNRSTLPAYRMPETLASPDALIDGKVVIPTQPAIEIDCDQISDCIIEAGRALHAGEPFGVHVVRNITAQQIVRVVEAQWGEEHWEPQLFVGDKGVHVDYTNLRAGDSPVTLHHTFYGKAELIQYQGSHELSKDAPSVGWTTDEKFRRDFDFSLPSFAITTELRGYSEKDPNIHHLKTYERIGDLAIFIHAYPHAVREVDGPRFSEAWYK